MTLEWVAEYCRKNNKTLRLYGSGWESNPRFAEYAAGFLAPGEEMRAVYQATDINLQIIETGFLHSRSLDGLAAGGFFLNRQVREFDPTEQSRLMMTRRAIETGCVTYGQLDASTDPLIAGAWAHARTLIRLGKPDEYCRMLDIWPTVPSEEIQFPHLSEITFADQKEFNAMADRFLVNPDLRRSVAARLRQVVVDRYSYDTRWRQFLSGITAGLRDAAQELATAKTSPAAPQVPASAAFDKKAA
jgi:Glycosyl transferases group 1